MSSILVVDDDFTFAKIMERFLVKHGFQVAVQHNVKEAVHALGLEAYDLLLLDYNLPDGTGIDVMTAAHGQGSKMPAIIMTTFNDVRITVKSMRAGAFDYITKPVNQDELLMVVKEALNRDTNSAAPGIPSFVKGESVAAQHLYEQINLIAPTDMSVIVHGESGTGKENVARMIHNQSDRAKHAFVAVDCGTLSSELASSELFGHVKGAFTGALFQKTGKFELANRGTLFLDEIGNLGHEVQVKLLRALQEKVIYAIGGNKEIRVDVRIIVATHEDLMAGVQQGKFREDLYHRLNEFKINIPPMRKRQEDLALFVDHFIIESNRDLKRNVKQLAPEVWQTFKTYDWPGNIRELKNITKRLVLLSNGEVAGADGLPEEMLLSTALPHADPETDLKAIQEHAEKALIEKTLQAVRYNKLKASRLLNINRSTLYAKMEKYNIKG